MRKKGFTLIEMVVVLAVVAILVAILVPTIARHIKEAKITRAQNEELVISAAILSLYKDTGKWPGYDMQGNSGTAVNRILSGETTDYIPQQTDGNGSANWYNLDPAVPMYYYLYYNDPNHNNTQNETGVDYLTDGEFRWKGPYIDDRTKLDPWGAVYVISARYFPGNPIITSATKANHRVLVLSAGINQVWETPFDDSTTRITSPDDAPQGDDIGFVIYTND